MKTTLTSAAAAIAAAAAMAWPTSAAEVGAKDEPIRLAMLEWSGAQISTQLAGRVLEKAGYTVEYVTAGNYPQFTGLGEGEISASVEIWMNNVGDIFPTVLAEGKIEDIGSLGLETREGWVYPRFMEEACPGLPDWKALEDAACIAALATPDTLPNGRFLDYPADWGSRAATIIADNKMPLTTVPAGSEGAMIAELRSSVAAQTPLVMMFWAPHFILAEVDVGWIDMPPCAQDTNEHCIKAPDVNKVVWSGFSAKWPAAYDVLKAFTVTTADQQKMMLELDGGETLESVTDAWIAGNEAVWKPWVDNALK